MRPTALLLALAALPLAAWGPRGHRLVANTSLQTLPPGLRAWFSGQEARYRDTCLEPDRQKDHDPEEDSRHHLHTEAYGGPAAVPRDLEAARKRLGPQIFLRRGQLPWAIGARYRRLVEAFRSREPARVVAESAWLCHYVADAQVPLHSTRNSNGKETGQKGIHKRWETTLVDWKVRGLDAPRPARVPEQPEREPWTWVAEAHALLPALLEADSRAGEPGEPGDSPYWDAFWTAERERVQGQLLRAAERTGDLVLAAWREAGAPAPRSGARSTTDPTATAE